MHSFGSISILHRRAAIQQEAIKAQPHKLKIVSAVSLTLRISIMVAKASYRPSSPKMPPHRELHHKCLEAQARAA